MNSKRLNDHSFKFGKISLLVPSHHLIARLFEYCKNAKSHCIFFIGTIKMHNKWYWILLYCSKKVRWGWLRHRRVRFLSRQIFKARDWRSPTNSRLVVHESQLSGRTVAGRRGQRRGEMSDGKCSQSGPNSIKKVSCIKFSYAGFQHSDWLEILDQPTRKLKTSVKLRLKQYLYRIGSRFSNCIWLGNFF